MHDTIHNKIVPSSCTNEVVLHVCLTMCIMCLTIVTTCCWRCLQLVWRCVNLCLTMFTTVSTMCYMLFDDFDIVLWFLISVLIVSVLIVLDSHMAPEGASIIEQSKSFREIAEPNVFFWAKKTQQSDKDTERQRDKETERPRGRVRSRLRFPLVFSGFL
jgi:hypothetical protein